MMPNVELRHPVIGESRRELARYDRHREIREQHERVRHLALVGCSEVDSADRLGVCDRTIHRIRHRAEPDDYRPPLPEPTDERAEQLEGTAELALHLSFLLRDEDPNLVWEVLGRLDRRRLQELTVIALAAIPLDMSRDELYSWVEQLSGAC
ncbi:hypothetical protein [Mycobacterium asiaticum]|uniref:hypothetical protein n=1 Tax=Mycobacterium asiaticum TaxID=1790 RepID=UPI0007F028F7|nr:hypothetical protein A9W94_07730 [Mycobacterium asiaticum]